MNGTLWDAAITTLLVAQYPHPLPARRENKEMLVTAYQGAPLTDGNTWEFSSVSDKSKQSCECGAVGLLPERADVGVGAALPFSASRRALPSACRTCICLCRPTTVPLALGGVLADAIKETAVTTSHTNE
ncbi:uncharacterized protein LOC123500009 [Portunus trituberculatus]|uniref:Uncharacterized protein n=1 Tax=Portunus trituberculatus TaxID=210409 RepID=A0A5B7FE15_PORTR|nr:uncharacterized protein LOC123500009 [Portunus trituberculatus]MPC43439.1 hypothetical protein [Portunus trituberculatus]